MMSLSNPFQKALPNFSIFLVPSFEFDFPYKSLGDSIHQLLYFLYMRLYNLLQQLLIMIREAPHNAFSRSKQYIPSYLASNYSRNAGISASKGAFSYSNIKQSHNGNTSMNKDIKYIKTNQYQYAQQSKDIQKDNRLAQINQNQRQEEKRQRERAEFRVKELRRQDLNTPISKSDQYYGKTYTPNASNNMMQSAENAYSYSNVKNEQKYNLAPKETLPKSKSLGLVGLNNIGNTCFMNSILQCMLNLPYFNDYFLENKHMKEINSNGRVAQAYARLVQMIRNSNSKSETPSDIKSAVALKKPRFSGYAQQDAQQFLAALLELLSLDLNRSRNPKYKELTADLSKQSLQDIGEDWWNYNRERENSVVCDYFTGQLLSKVICCSCKNQSIAFDNTWDFALNFSQNDNGDIVKMLQNFIREETISNDYYCSKCKAFRECKRKLDFFRLPTILVLQIKRFAYGKYSKQKLNNRVKVSQQLNLSRLITQSQHSSTKNPTYRLVGVVNHSGDINFGHYTAECKNPINGKWYTFNDSSVSETRMSSSFESSAPYLLFYAKNQ